MNDESEFCLSMLQWGAPLDGKPAECIRKRDIPAQNDPAYDPDKTHCDRNCSCPPYWHPSQPRPFAGSTQPNGCDQNPGARGENCDAEFETYRQRNHSRDINN